MTRNATLVVSICLLCQIASASDLEWVRVADEGDSFVLEPSKKHFVPWGFNYDHNAQGQLLEDYWDDNWSEVEDDFREMRALGANIVRIHLQLGRFMSTPTQPNEQSLKQLAKLLRLAERTGLYLDLTGLGCYHKQDVPEWYDELDEQNRWMVQARFWKFVAQSCADSPAVFCYDLMNEPVVAGSGKARKDWLGPAFAGKHFVQFVSKDTSGRGRAEIAKAWIDQLVAAIRQHDKRHLITVGMVPWSLDRPGLTSGFVPGKVAENLDFIALHLYPESDKIEDALETVKGFNIGKPIVIEEIFPLKCTGQELIDFINRSEQHATGWISFYWGQTPEELRSVQTIGNTLQADWLETFQQLQPKLAQ